MENAGGNKLLYVLVGCAGLCFLGLCAATGLGLYLFAQDGAEAGRPAPPLPVAPGPRPADEPAAGAASADPRGEPLVPRMRVAATVTAARGAATARGASCLFDVQPPTEATPLCRAQVICGDRLLYGGKDAGYFRCAASAGPPPSVAGQDPQTTGLDRDAAMTIDTASRTLLVRDDEHGPLGAFEVEARIDSVE